MSGTTTPPTSTALLEELRQRIRSEYAPPPQTEVDRLAAFGRGILSGRGSLLDNLTAGVAAQEQAAAARAEQQRRALEMERQVVENAVREETERNRLAQSASQFAAEGPLREARIRSYNATAAAAGRPQIREMIDPATQTVVLVDETGRIISRTGLLSPRVMAGERRIDAATEARARTAAENAVTRARSDASRTMRTLSPEEERRIYNETYERNLNPTAAAPAAGGGAQPSRVLQYGGPTPPQGPRTPLPVAPQQQ